jgi:hypothetical protein
MKASSITNAILATLGLVSSQLMSRAQPPGPILWVFHDEDPDYTNPPFDDTLAALDEAGQALFIRNGFNIAQTIGGSRVIATTPERDSILVCEDSFVARRFSKIGLNGDRSFLIERPISAVDVATDGTIFALEDYTGTIFGQNILRISSEGVVRDQAAQGGFDLAVDSENQAIFVVGADIKYLDFALHRLWAIDPIPWSAVSVDVTTDGSAWVAERQHPDVFSSANRLLRVSREGVVIRSIDLDYSPFCVRVDRNDGSVYVAGDQLYKYDAEGTPVVAASLGVSPDSFQPGWSLAVDAVGQVWVGTWSDVRKFSPNGDPLLITNAFSRPSDTYVALSVGPGATEPKILNQPRNQTVVNTSNATFNVITAGTPPLVFEWRRNGVPLGDGGNISGVTTRKLVVSQVGIDDLGQYSVLVTNAYGSVLSSDATLAVASPRLVYQTFGDILLLSWPTAAPGWVIEASPTLSLNDWVPLAQPPLQIGDQYVVSMSMAQTRRFYRLRLGR